MIIFNKIKSKANHIFILLMNNADSLNDFRYEQFHLDLHASY